MPVDFHFFVRLQLNMNKHFAFAVKYIFDIDFRVDLSASFLPYWYYNILIFMVDSFLS